MNPFNDIEKTLAELTDSEKILLIGGKDRFHTAPVERLSIPSIRFSDGPNGVRGKSYFPGVPSACFPNGTNLGATWDKSLMYEAGKFMGIESKYKGAHAILGPTINIQRSPLGGRGYESYSEDPVLSGSLATSIINGIQSQNVAACVKHYVCNDIEDDRRAININITERALGEIYLLPFELAVKNSKPRMVMTSYSKVRGEHVAESKYLLCDILRDEWKWEGTTISDWGGTYSTAEAITNGLDLEMPGPPIFRRQDLVYISKISKKISNTSFNNRVRNMLRLIKYCIESGVPENAPESSENNTEATAKKLRCFSNSGIVLLKNDGGILPLDKKDKIAVIGPNAKNTSISGGGSAALNSYEVTNIYEAILAKLGYSPEYTVGAHGHKFLPPLGSKLKRDDNSTGYTAKVYLEPSSCKNRTLIDEFRLTESYLRMPDYENDRISNNLFYVDFEGNFIPDSDGEYEFGLIVVGTVQLFIDGNLLVDNKTTQKRGTSFYEQGTVEVKNSIYLQKGSSYKIKIEFGSGPTSKINDFLDSLVDGRGAVGFGVAKVIDPEKEISRAVSIAKRNDTVVLVVGLSKEWESENFDRPDMKLPGYIDRLVSQVAQANPNTIVVNQSGTPMEFPWLNEVPGLIQAWFGGTEAGNAVADVIFGDVNPSGKLPLTFPIKVQDNPTFVNFKSNKGELLYGEDVFVGYRFYEKCEENVAFPFGFGLSYSKFEFKELNSLSIKDGNLKFNVLVKNSGNRNGSEVVQVYIKALSPDIERPLKELKDFQKVYLKAKEENNVHFEIEIKRSTSYWDSLENQWLSESGEYDILIGNSSDNILLKTSFILDTNMYWLFF